MKVEVTVPHEFQGTAIGLLNKRKGQMTGTDAQEQQAVIQADVPLSQMFGFSTEIRSATQVRGAEADWAELAARCLRRRSLQATIPRSCSAALPPAHAFFPFLAHCRTPPLSPRRALQGKGEFTMEYKTQAFVSGEVKRELIKKYEAERKAESAAKK